MLLIFLQVSMLLSTCINAGSHCHDSSFKPNHILRVTMGNLSIGCGTTRQSHLINGTSPGPEIRLTPGKISWIRVYNDMPSDNLTMHWHGLSQRMAPFSDGTPHTLQWPIPPMHFFDYEVFPGGDDAGTYFYHSHVGFQAVTVSGPLIVEDEGKPPYQYHDERVIELTDFFYKTDKNIAAGLLANPFVWSGETHGVLLNGQGVTDVVQASGNYCALPTFDLLPGKTYRFRFIGSTALSLVSLQIEGHNLTVIAADARYTQAHVTDYLQIGTGQRFDLKDLKRTTFFMKYQTKDRPPVYTGYAVFRYNSCQMFSASPAPGISIILPNNLSSGNFPSANKVTRRLTMTFRPEGSPTGHIRWYENNLGYTEYSSPRPLLPDVYLYGESAVPNYTLALENEGCDPEFKAWPAMIGEVLEIVIENTGSEVAGNGGLDIHPFHAHAGHYYDIGSGNGTYNATENEVRLAGYSPVLRDTTYLYKYEAATGNGTDASWRAWRIRVTDAGAYLIHCHILQHMIMGMQTAWVFGNATEIQKIPLAEASGYLTYGGSAYGNQSYDPIVYHYYEDTPDEPWLR
ncbi:L-ascorbate oxidase [Kockovaella imperatae]|uniref:laccase n=1 Tax=Kockovaella imperatae TaxID=4999 RepID=A0A1Y1U870_9TREE|nr:L-ascorbate oxidase [Kockovaella imperatae]ORX33315.1 L-ascorbate oxidase [Kockovaella imperatae]